MFSNDSMYSLMYKYTEISVCVLGRKHTVQMLGEKCPEKQLFGLQLC